MTNKVTNQNELSVVEAPMTDTTLLDLLRKPFVPKEPDFDKDDEGEDGYTQLWLQNEATKVAISVAVYARLAEGVRGTTKEGKLQAVRPSGGNSPASYRPTSLSAAIKVCWCRPTTYRFGCPPTKSK